MRHKDVFDRTKLYNRKEKYQEGVEEKCRRDASLIITVSACGNGERVLFNHCKPDQSESLLLSIYGMRLWCRGPPWNSLILELKCYLGEPLQDRACQTSQSSNIKANPLWKVPIPEDNHAASNSAASFESPSPPSQSVEQPDGAEKKAGKKRKRSGRRYLYREAGARIPRRNEAVRVAIGFNSRRASKSEWMMVPGRLEMDGFQPFVRGLAAR